MKASFQRNDNGCGYAAMRTLAYTLKKQKWILCASEPFERSESPSVTEILNYGRSLGLECKAFRCSRIAKAETHGQPFIAVIAVKGANHAVVIKEIKGPWVKLFDPAKGWERMPLSAFEDIWTNIVFLPDRTFEVPKEKTPPKRHFGWQSLAALSCETLSLAMLFAGFCFITDEGDFLSPVLLFSGFALLTLSTRLFSFASLWRLDERTLVSIDGKPLDKRESYLRRYGDYKTAVMGAPLNLVSGIVEAIGIALVVCVSEPMALWAVGIAATISACKAVLVRPQEERRKEWLSEMEGEYLKGLPSVTSLNLADASYSYGIFVSVTNTLSIIVELVGALLLTLITGNVSLNFLLFVFMGTALTEDKLTQACDAVRSLTCLDRLGAYFLWPKR